MYKKHWIRAWCHVVMSDLDVYSHILAPPFTQHQIPVTCVSQDKEIQLQIDTDT